MTLPKFKKEHTKVILSFLALFFLLCSYYIIKPFRAGVFYKNFDYQTAPYLQLSCIIGSLLLTKVFTSFYKKLSSIKLVGASYFIISLIHVSFYFLLTISSKKIAFIFCLWASIYFLLALAILWGNTNQIFSSKQAKIYYGFVLFGALSGSTCGSILSGYIIKLGYLDYSLLFSSALLLISLIFIYFADHYNIDKITDSVSLDKQKKEEEKEKNQRGFFSDFQELFKKNYLLCIAIMVFCLTFSKTAFEYQTLPIIDLEISKQVFLIHFQDLNNKINKKQKLKQKFNLTALEFIRSLKKLGEFQKLETIDLFKKTHNLSYDIQSSYKSYLKGFQTQISLWHNQTQNYQNIFALVLLLFGSSFILQKLGVSIAISLLPVCFFILLILTNFEISLFAIQICKVVAGALDFSINNASKELLFVSANSEANLRFKPFIEGPIFRLGNACSAIAFIFLGKINGINSQAIFLSLALIIVSIWFLKARDVAKQYNQLEGV
ncbi:MAG: hypothetical protein COB02_12890 [Candidatus Cloacimonadota bacterium]|nr:MAG: hypothetical protein COB02_12890 [Candidatus Cloacimonadota bacterium]